MMALRDKRTEWLRIQRYRQMSPDERVEASVRMFEDLVSIVRSSVLDANPGIAPEALEREVRRRVLPRGLAELADTRRRQQT